MNIKRHLSLIFFACAFTLASGGVFAQRIDSTSLVSIIKALQDQVTGSPSVFPLESYEGGIQSLESGLRQAYFGYGERRYAHRFDFHPAMDVGYFPTETGRVKDESGKSWKVRAPQAYLKRVYAIQKGELVSIRLLNSGYKLTLKHTLKTPYLDNDGRPYHHYFTCYRHLDSRSLSYLSGLARVFTNNPKASYEDLFGKYVFEAGEQVALVGFSPEKSVEAPRAHLDFSLNLFADPNKGTNIRNYALNPLLLFPPFEYADTRSYEIGAGQLPAYQFVVNTSNIVAPTKEKNGGFALHIISGGRTAEGEQLTTRYFALNGLDITLTNDGQQVGTYRIDRHSKLGYDTSSYELLDNPNGLAPYLIAPLEEQGDVYTIAVVLPKVWLDKQEYDWSRNGTVSIEISSIWKGYLEGHSRSLTIPIPAADTSK